MDPQPLSLERKVALLTGADFWTLRPEPAVGLRAIVVSDGPAGVRGRTWDERDTSANVPSPTALAATWDQRRVERIGRLLAAEARRKGVDVLLAPTVNLHRTPYGGRHFECLSEDPLLSGRIGAAYVRGVQSQGVAATVKHFVANDSESERLTVDVVADERTLRELYLAPFETIVREGGVWAVMAAYNGVNGHPMTESPMLRDILQREWGFDGLTMTDWFAGRSLATARAGLDLIMPGPNGPWGEQLVAAVRAGEVPESTVDDKVERLLRLAGRVGALAEVHTRLRAPRAGSYLVGASGLGRFVLNVGGVTVADEHLTLPPGADFVEGIMRPPQVLAPVALAAGEEAELLVRYLPGDGAPPETVTFQLNVERDSDDDAELAEAVAAAADADVAVVVVGTTEEVESEGFDRTGLALPGRQDELVRRVAAANPRTVVVVNSGAPVLLPWVEEVAAVVLAWFPGQEFGNALGDVLTGAVEPGGRLPVTWPAGEDDLPSTTPVEGVLRYDEGLAVGYRAGRAPLFAFGHGLGYTTWEYLAAEATTGGVSVRLRNSGGRPGREIVQVYASRPDSAVERPPHWLVGWAVVSAEPGAEATVDVTFAPRAFHHWAEGAWRTESGTFLLNIGPSSAELPLTVPTAVD
ncbi:hypothetical protein Val02_30140 [Virgisporangium aliadipatigenens]|uniref:Fibronectin type III-like domain-containing protein n=1 Tax=Virgisporangium aliadipatigenens TaxID=741659 RepID=A0A8J3YL55_9ACTN|nr:glycoside hydrolase family 3 C-terminal domain-containing protein [Virgisporangium aliadipatigenens]GIJ46128.1 hypothetical protein Val02_30140 [Virgisporangium aliadipatigenens]